MRRKETIFAGAATAYTLFLFDAAGMKFVLLIDRDPRARRRCSTSRPAASTARRLFTPAEIGALRADRRRRRHRRRRPVDRPHHPLTRSTPERQRHDSEPTSSSTYGVHSEVGRLRKVLVCAPGLAHRRLTPSNNDDLLFDDVMWVENAQRDHADFVNKLTQRGVEVVELHDAARPDACRSPGARDWLLDRKIEPNHVGLGLVDGTRAYLESLAAARSSRSTSSAAWPPATCPTTSAPATSAWPASRPAPAST